MAEHYLGQIRITSFNFAPPGFAKCDGQLLTVAQNAALFGILGDRYGGDGSTTFALPDLRGRTPICVGSHEVGGTAHLLASAIGEETHVLSASEVPSHSHDVMATNNNAPFDSLSPAGKVLAAGGTNFYGDFPAPTPMGPTSVTSGGGGQGHANMMPFLTVNFIIAVSGDVPT